MTWNLEEHGYKPECEEVFDEPLWLWLLSYLAIPGIILIECIKRFESKVKEK